MRAVICWRIVSGLLALPGVQCWPASAGRHDLQLADQVMCKVPPTIPDEDDRSLLRRFKDGDQGAATELFAKYATRIQALAQAKTSSALNARFDPDDVIQSVFNTFFRRASLGHYNVQEGDELWQLLLVLALNKIRDLANHHRAQKRDVTRTRTPSNDQIRFPSTPHSNGDSLAALELVVRDFLGSLPDEQSEVAKLRMEGYQVEEIASKTGRSKRTIERTLSLLREHLVEQSRAD